MGWLFKSKRDKTLEEINKKISSTDEKVEQLAALIEKALQENKCAFALSQGHTNQVVTLKKD